MKRIYLLAAFLGAIAALYYLYQRQLGAVSFFLLSIFFFSRAVKLLSKRTNKEDGKAKKTQE